MEPSRCRSVSGKGAARAVRRNAGRGLLPGRRSFVLEVFPERPAINLTGFFVGGGACRRTKRPGPAMQAMPAQELPGPKLAAVAMEPSMNIGIDWDVWVGVCLNYYNRAGPTDWNHPSTKGAEVPTNRGSRRVSIDRRRNNARRGSLKTHIRQKACEIEVCHALNSRQADGVVGNAIGKGQSTERIARIAGNDGRCQGA